MTNQEIAELKKLFWDKASEGMPRGKTVSAMTVDQAIEVCRNLFDQKDKELKSISLCTHCSCMTKNVCGKCRKVKDGLD